MCLYTQVISRHWLVHVIVYFAINSDLHGVNYSKCFVIIIIASMPNSQSRIFNCNENLVIVCMVNNN